MSFLQRLFAMRSGGLILGQYGPGGLLRCRLPLAAFDTHMYIVGKTKKGKSTFLEHLAYQLITQGQGCGLLDPHADLGDDLLASLASKLAANGLGRRIVYFDPSRKDYLLPFNVLAAPGEPYAVAQQVLEAFRRTWPESLREAPRFANIVLAATLALIENGLTLVEMPRLLTDTSYREALLERVTDAEVVRFFRTRYDRWGREQALIIESVLNKVGALVINPTLRLILGQRRNALPFRQIMDEGKVLLCNLGRTDGESRRLLGSLIVTGLEQAALSRQDQPLAGRKRFYLVLDEFQDYVAQEGSAQTLAQMLAECRKFGLHLLLAHQNHSQLSERLQGALENAQLKVIFGVGRQTAQSLVGEVFRPEVGAAEDGTGRQRGPTLAEQWEGFVQQAQRLGRREMLVQLPEGEGVRRLRTCTVPQTKVSPGALDALKQRLAKQSGQSVLAMRRALARREGTRLVRCERTRTVRREGSRVARNEMRAAVGDYEIISGGTHDQT
jgi:DNA helicase HerA-like ATPase